MTTDLRIALAHGGTFLVAQNSQYIEWWYKNGDKGKQHYAIEYETGNKHVKSLFYVDFVIRMKNGHVYLFDTETYRKKRFSLLCIRVNFCILKRTKMQGDKNRRK